MIVVEEDRSEPSAVGEPEALLARLDEARREAAALVADRLQWEAAAREQRQAAEDLAAGLRDLGEQVGRAEAERDQARAAAAAAEVARRALEERLGEAERAFERAQAAVAASEQRASAGRRRTERLLDETCRLHNLALSRQLAEALEADTLFDNIVEISVELAGAEKGVYLRPDGPVEILATERFDEARPDSPLLAAVTKQVAARQEPVVLNDPAAISALADDPLAASIRNLVGYPIVARERLTGVVVVANSRGEGFTEEDTRLLLGIGSHAAVVIENRRLRREMEAAYAGTVALLCDVIEAKDPYTHGHCEEVAVLALATARRLGLGPEEQRAVFQAGLLHDVGKIAVSDGILLKQGPLLPAERDVIETHATAGADLVRRVPALAHLASIIEHHHERYDGTGYPGKLAGEAIPLLSRVLCVADAFEAMGATRPYRPALDGESARAELRRGAGSQFDPAAVEALLHALDDPAVLDRLWRAGFGPTLLRADAPVEAGA